MSMRAFILPILLLCALILPGLGADKGDKPDKKADMNGKSYTVQFPVEKKSKPESLSFTVGELTITSLGSLGIPYTAMKEGSEISFSGEKSLPDGTSVTVEGRVSKSGEIRGSITGKKKTGEVAARNFNGKASGH